MLMISLAQTFSAPGKAGSLERRLGKAKPSMVAPIILESHLNKKGRISMAPWTKRELAVFKKLATPIKIQIYLNKLAYDSEPGTASPRFVMKEKKANCFEGALFAAAALRRIGHPPLLVDIRAVNDDDHVLAVFRRNGAWGDAWPSPTSPCSASASPSIARSAS